MASEQATIAVFHIRSHHSC